MSGIKGKDTSPELLVRHALHARGFRYRLGGAGLPGKPDLVFPKFSAAIFIHGCFWHAHACNDFHVPSSNIDFWVTKLSGNVERDRRQIKAIQKVQWRVLVIWECSVRKTSAARVSSVVDIAVDWLLNYDHSYLEISKGRNGSISKRRTTARSL